MHMNIDYECMLFQMNNLNNMNNCSLPGDQRHVSNRLLQTVLLQVRSVLYAIVVSKYGVSALTPESIQLFEPLQWPHTS